MDPNISVEKTEVIEKHGCQDNQESRLKLIIEKIEEKKEMPDLIQYEIKLTHK